MLVVNVLQKFKENVNLTTVTQVKLTKFKFEKTFLLILNFILDNNIPQNF